MNQSLLVNGVWLLAATVLLALLLLAAAKYLRWRSGLPPGEVVYNDTSEAAGATLFSERYGLKGKPGYLLDDGRGGLLPVEVKSGVAPANGQPYKSHLMQLAVYFLLIEDALEKAAPYGLIRYRDRTLRVANTAQLRHELLLVLKQMRAALAAGAARRSHQQARRCRSCSLASACDERLGRNHRA